MGLSPGLASWKLSFELSPIIFTNGIATNVPGNMLPIISITEAIYFPDGILDTGLVNIPLDRFFANFKPLPGASMIDQQIGKYPFANQAVAANAVIAQPLRISMLMICPVREQSGYALKLAIMQSLQSSLKQHNNTGGTYTIITPSVFYADCVMTSMTDVSAGESKQVQTEWRLDFEQPLLTQAQANQALQSYNAKMGMIATGGAPTNGDLTGLGAINGPANTAMTPAVIPAGSSPISSSTGVSPGITDGGLGGDFDV